MKNNSIKKVLILALILAVPGFLYYLLTEKGKNRYRPLPIFGTKTVLASYHLKRGKKIPDTLYHKVLPVCLHNQEGQQVLVPDTGKHITILNFFYSECSSCDKMNEALQTVVQEYEHNKRLHFFSISIAGDSINALNKYASSFNPPKNKWDFVTGNGDSVAAFSRKQLFVDVLENPVHKNQYISKQTLILLDAQGRIRGYYDALSKEQVDKLKDEVKVLIAEELRKVTI